MAPSNDLPDVMQADNAVGTAGADDLLAQLAGDEIDRLLTEAEARVTEQPAVTEQPELPLTEAAPPPLEIPQTAVSQAPVAVSDTTASQPAAQVGQAEENLANADTQIASQLDALFQELTQETAAAAPIAQQNPPSTAVDSQATINVPTADVADASADESSTVEEDKIPLLIKPLVWINLPFGFLSENAKRSFGWAAIVTLVNASILLAATYLLKKH